ncbi:hypothetical protein N7470_005081 [Penicillium chermesinum]|nr:hypothetical protein N7470_005081 [Penicillium chermesinum]
MSSTQQVETARVHPRRQPILNTALPSLVTESPTSKMPLKKGETFHTPTSPAKSQDPVLDVRSLPRRSPTCLEALTATEERMTSILSRLTLDASDEEAGQFANTLDDVLADGMHFSDKQVQEEDHGHESDSGLGTSVGSRDDISSPKDYSFIVHTKVLPHSRHCKRKTPASFLGENAGPRRQLDIAACKQIERHIIVPILNEEKLKPFHPLVRTVPRRIVKKQIVCLRDLEKTLLWLAPKFSTSRASYLHFSEFTIQCLHTSTSHLNDRDQRLPADRPYTNGYFLDLVAQVRRYAAMIQASRERVQATQEAQEKKGETGETSEKADKPEVSVPTATLEGGLAQTGKPLELVIVQDGKPISMRTGLPYEPQQTPSTFKRAISFNEHVDEGVQRSMARRKKNAPPMDINQKCAHCDKVFKRPCDLTKHEKTHSRPWKCSEPSCKYFQLGWPTEKERDRHVNDKHSETPALYKCNFKPCTYASKRESNCKQHMEKAHGWVYIRSKNNARGGSKRGSSIQASPDPAPFPLPSLFPETQFNFNDPPAPAHGDEYSGFFDNSPYQNSTGGMSSDYSFPTSFNLDSFQAQFEAGDPNGLIPELELHRESMNPMSVPSADSVPELMGMSYEGSPLETADNNSLNFDFEWSQLGGDMTSMSDNYTALHMQLPTPEPVESHMQKGLAMGLPQMPMGGAGNLPGLSPGAQGNLMLYSPESSADQYDYGVHAPSGNDFTLYEQPAMQMRNVASVNRNQAAQYRQSQTMFPPLAEQGLQTWPEQHPQNGGSESYLPSDMELKFM